MPKRKKGVKATPKKRKISPRTNSKKTPKKKRPIAPKPKPKKRPPLLPPPTKKRAKKTSKRRIAKSVRRPKIRKTQKARERWRKQLEKERAAREAAEARAKELQAIIDAKMGTQGWVDAEDVEMLHMNGSLAKEPSVLRHIPEARELLQRLEDTGGNPDTPAFQREAQRIADETERPIREVYTLFYSP